MIQKYNFFTPKIFSSASFTGASPLSRGSGMASLVARVSIHHLFFYQSEF